MKYIRFMKGPDESFKIFPGNLKHSDEAQGIERDNILSAGFIYFDFTDDPEWYISSLESSSLGIGPRVDDTEFFKEQFKK